MRSFLMLLLSFVTVGTIAAYAQGGGRAEPNRIKFAPHNTSATVAGTLSNSQEMEYVFAARKGQKVTIRNPKISLFDFRVFSEENFPDGDFDSSPTYTFTIPETGDYMFFIRKKLVKTPRTARFSMTLTIK